MPWRARGGGEGCHAVTPGLPGAAAANKEACGEQRCRATLTPENARSWQEENGVSRGFRDEASLGGMFLG